MRLRLRAALSYLPIFAMILSFFLSLSLSLSKKRALSQSRRRRWKETTTTLLLFLFLCVAVVALFSTKSKANTNTTTDDENREKKSNAFWRLLLRLFFFCPFFFVSLFCKCLGYYIEKKKDCLLCWIFALFFEVHLLSETLVLKVKISTLSSTVVFLRGLKFIATYTLCVIFGTAG